MNDALGGGLGDMAKMLMAAQEVQGKMQALQEQLANTLVEAESGGGLVKATATAKGKLTALTIDPSIYGSEDKDVVEDLIVAAVAAVHAKGNALAQEETQKAAQAMGLPGGLGSPF